MEPLLRGFAAHKLLVISTHMYRGGDKATVEDGKVEKDKEREDTNTQGRRHKRTGEKTQTYRGEDTNAQGRRKGQRRKVDKGKEEKNGMFQLSVFPEG